MKRGKEAADWKRIEAMTYESLGLLQEYADLLESVENNSKTYMSQEEVQNRRKKVCGHVEELKGMIGNG